MIKIKDIDQEAVAKLAELFELDVTRLGVMFDLLKVLDKWDK